VSIGQEEVAEEAASKKVVDIKAASWRDIINKTAV
jgi:hypothetical protein